jgi:hypothetical protein
MIEEVIVIGDKRRCAEVPGVSAKTLYNRLSACNHYSGVALLSVV